jgi:hypothetical protein
VLLRLRDTNPSGLSLNIPCITYLNRLVGCAYPKAYPLNSIEPRLGLIVFPGPQSHCRTFSVLLIILHCDIDKRYVLNLSWLKPYHRVVPVYFGMEPYIFTTVSTRRRLPTRHSLGPDFQGAVPVSVHNISLSLIDDLDTWTYRGECDRGYPK